MFTHYDALHIKEDASPEVVRAAYKALAQKWHPDKHTGTKEHAELRFKAISAAYEVLSDPDLRVSYDAELKASRWKTEESQPDPKPRPEPESVYKPAARAEKESIPSLLWSGKVPLWKLVWVYMIGLPLGFIFVELAFARENGGWTFVSSAILVATYLLFIHVCLWRTARSMPKVWIRRLTKGYCWMVILSPLLAISALQLEGMYREWQWDKISSKKEWYEDYPTVEAAKTSARQGPPTDAIIKPASNPGPWQNYSDEIIWSHVAKHAAMNSWLAANPNEKAKFQGTLFAFYRKYPFLDSDSPQASSTAIDEVILEIKGYMSSGISFLDAANLAADKVAPKYSKH